MDLGADSHPLDEAVSRDGDHLYDLTDGSHVITGFAIRDDGSLAAVGPTVPVPVGAAGLVAI